MVLLATGLVVVGLTYFAWRWQDARSVRAEGLRLAGEAKWAAAEPYLERAYARDANDLDVVVDLSRAKLKGADPASAEPYLSRWCELSPTNPFAFQVRMDLRHRIARGMWTAADRLRWMESAAADGLRVLELEPGNDQVRRELAWLELQLGRFPEAEAACRAAIRSNPRDGWLYYLLAKALHGQTKRTEAAAVLDPVLAAQPKFAEALLLRGILHRELDEPAKAVPVLRQALAQDTCPRREGLYQLGLALAAAGEKDDAAKVMAEVDLLTLKSAMSADAAPETDSMRVQIAEAMLGMGQLREAKEHLDKVISETPDFAPAHRVLAIYFDRTNQPDRAAEHRRLATGKDRR